MGTEKDTSLSLIVRKGRNKFPTGGKLRGEVRGDWLSDTGKRKIRRRGRSRAEKSLP